MIQLTKNHNLQLRQPTAEDTLVLRALWKDEKARQFLGGVASDDIIDKKFLSLQDHWNKYGFGECAVFDVDHNQVIGLCGLHYSEEGIELSYMFFPESWGKGKATEAALAILEHGFNHLNLDKIIAITQEANNNSRRLLENIGMCHIRNLELFGAAQCLYELTQEVWFMKIAKDNYIFKTQRLGFRLLEKSDLSYLETLTSDPVVMQYFPGGVQTKKQIEARMNDFISYHQEKGLPCFVIFELETGEFIGRAGFGPLESGEIEVGYVLHQKFWGKGYASEVLTQLFAWAEQHIDVDYIIAYCLVENIGSWRVMEKCGMQYFKNEITKGVECKFYKKNLK